MEYEVILSTEAKEHFRKIIHHLLYKIKSEQAQTAWQMIWKKR